MKVKIKFISTCLTCFIVVFCSSITCFAVDETIQPTTNSQISSDDVQVRFGDFNNDGVNDVLDVTAYQRLMLNPDFSAENYVVVPREELDLIFEQIDYIITQNQELKSSVDDLSSKIPDNLDDSVSDIYYMSYDNCDSIESIKGFLSSSTSDEALLQYSKNSSDNTHFIAELVIFIFAFIVGVFVCYLLYNFLRSFF